MISAVKRLLVFILLLCPVYAASAVISISPDKEKINYSNETMHVGENTYKIPPPWRGNRIRIPRHTLSSLHAIPTEYTHEQSRLYVTKHTHSALMNLLAAAKKSGFLLKIESGYRSPAYQQKIFTQLMNDGREFSDIIRYVAPPGYSQHALGTAVDFYPSNWRFAKLPEYLWLKQNAAQYGFTETYPRKNGLHYPWEAWHWNYAPQEQETEHYTNEGIAQQTITP